MKSFDAVDFSEWRSERGGGGGGGHCHWRPYPYQMRENHPQKTTLNEDLMLD